MRRNGQLQKGTPGRKLTGLTKAAAAQQQLQANVSARAGSASPLTNLQKALLDHPFTYARAATPEGYNGSHPLHSAGVSDCILLGGQDAPTSVCSALHTHLSGRWRNGAVMGAGREENGHAAPPPPPPGAPSASAAKPPRPSSQHHASSSASASRFVLCSAMRCAFTCSLLKQYMLCLRAEA